MVFKKCPNCESENPDSTEFCLECGAKMESGIKVVAPPSDSPKAQAPAPAPPPPQPEAEEEAPEEPSPPAAPRSLFGERYKIDEIIGTGRLGTVYKVFDKALDRELALKSIRPEIVQDGEAFDGFSRELKAERGIVHKNIARLFELNLEKGTPFITMEYVVGQSLRALREEKNGRLPVSQAAGLAKQLAKGLAEAHRLGVVHLDLRPSNILVDREGTPKIMDLGITRWLRSKGLDAVAADPDLGKYQSPEQIEGRISDHRSDIFSLGAILYELVTGVAPFPAEPREPGGGKIPRETPRNPRELNPLVPPELGLLILRCLDPGREKRYQSALELSLDLEKIEEGKKSEPAPAAAPQAPRESRPVPKPEPRVSPEPVSSKSEIKTPRKKLSFRLPRVSTRLALPAVVVVGAVVLGALIWRIAYHPGKTVRPEPRMEKITVAVLPFEDTSATKSREYVGEGMAKAVIGGLNRLPGLRAPGAASSSTLGGKSADARQAAAALGADYLLSGGFEVNEKSLRGSVRMVKSADGSKVWEKQFDQDSRELFAVLEGIADGAAEALRVQVPPEKKGRLIRGSSLNPEACDFYFHGRSLAGRGGRDNLEKAVDFLQKAVDKDPAWAAARAALANACIDLGIASLWSPDRAFPRARREILKALEVEPFLAETRLALALLKWRSEWDFAGAEREFKEALKSSPEEPEIRRSHAMFLAAQGRHDEALSEMKTAQSLDPLSPKVNAGVGTVLYYSRLYDQAALELGKARDTSPADFEAYYQLGLLDIQTGEFEQSIQMFRQAALMGGDQGEIFLRIGFVLARLGMRQDVGKILNEAIRASHETYVSFVSLGSVYAGLLEKDQVFACLEKALAERDASLVYLRVSPLFDSVRSDPWFIGLLSKIGI
jgi:serine/threonine-protein kinase